MRKTRKKRATIQSVYWINLDRSTERRTNMLNVFKHPFFNGMNFHRIPALDGKDPKFLPLLKQCKNVYLSKFKAPIYACTLSHIKAIQTFVQSGEEMALICEDDLSMAFTPKKGHLNACIRNAPHGWEILQLFYFFIGKETLPKTLYTENTIINHYDSTLAYIIHRKGAIRFLQELVPSNQIVFNPSIAHSADTYIFSMMKTYVYKYPLFAPTTDDSTIHISHIGMQRDNVKKLQRLLKQERQIDTM